MDSALVWSEELWWSWSRPITPSSISITSDPYSAKSFASYFRFRYLAPAFSLAYLSPTWRQLNFWSSPGLAWLFLCRLYSVQITANYSFKLFGRFWLALIPRLILTGVDQIWQMQSIYTLDFRRLPGPVLDRAHFPQQRLVIQPNQYTSVTIWKAKLFWHDKLIPANYFWVKSVRFSSGHVRNFRTFPTIFWRLSNVAENVRRWSDDLFNDDILVCCDKVKRLFGLFSEILNLVFVINHVFKNNSSEFVSRREKLSLMLEIDLWSPQAWDSRIMRWQVYKLKKMTKEFMAIWRPNNRICSLKLILFHGCLLLFWGVSVTKKISVHSPNMRQKIGTLSEESFQEGC